MNNPCTVVLGARWSPTTNCDAADDDESALIYRRYFADALLRIRWGAVPLCLLVVPLYPPAPKWPILLLAFLLGIGNLALTWLLQNRSLSPARRLRLEATFGTALEWTVGVGTMGALNRDPNTHAPVALLLLMLLTACRFGMRGLLWATVAATLSGGGFVASQLAVVDLIDAAEARNQLVGWGLLIGATAVVLGGLIQFAMACSCWERQRWKSRSMTERRMACGMTRREWTLLQILAKESLTYEGIGAELHISPETVKTHVRHLGAKLGVAGRRNIVVAARERGLLPPANYPPAV